MTAGLPLVFTDACRGFDLPDLSLMVRMRFGSSTISEKISLNRKISPPRSLVDFRLLKNSLIKKRRKCLFILYVMPLRVEEGNMLCLTL